MNFEAHITVAANRRVMAASVAADWGWHTSSITDDPVLGKGDKFYLTSHGKDYIELFKQMELVVADLNDHGIPVLRQKIELIMYDTKGKK